MTNENNTPAKSRAIWYRLWRFVRLPMFVYLGLCLVLMALENRLVYPIPSDGTEDSWQLTQTDQTEVTFTAADGTQLHGWYFVHPQPKYALLYCHGNGENISHNAGYMSQLRNRLNANVFIFDYRGYGKSAGAPSEAGIILDGLAAQRWLADEMQLETNQIVLMGRSLGGGVAVALAEQQGARALVLQNTFASMADLAAEQFPFLPVRSIMRNRFSSAKRIQAYHGPLIQIHGTEDRIVPYSQGQQLFEAAPTDNKQWIENTGQGHNEPLPNGYFDALVGFLHKLPDTH